LGGSPSSSASNELKKEKGKEKGKERERRKENENSVDSLSILGYLPLASGLLVFSAFAFIIFKRS
jgi:hypothetical protein